MQQAGRWPSGPTRQGTPPRNQPVHLHHQRCKSGDQQRPIDGPPPRRRNRRAGTARPGADSRATPARASDRAAGRCAAGALRGRRRTGRRRRPPALLCGFLHWDRVVQRLRDQLVELRQPIGREPRRAEQPTPHRAAWGDANALVPDRERVSAPRSRRRRAAPSRPVAGRDPGPA